MKVLPHLRQAEHGRAHAPREDVECHQLTNRERSLNHKLRTEEQNSCCDQFVDELNKLTGVITQISDAKTCGHVTSKLLFPTALHMRLYGHGFQRFDTGYAFH